jgi:hypothetical protein
MNNLIRNTLASGLLAAMLVASPGFAQPRGKHAPSAEAIAAVPGLTQSQRDDILRIETESHAEHKALWEAERTAHEAIREQTIDELRAALGDDAYATYAAWKMEQRAARRHGRHHGRGSHGAPMDAGDDAGEPSGEG